MQSLSSAVFLENHPLEQLKELSTFGALSAQTIGWLLEEGQILRFDRGESLFEPGRSGDSFFVILDGSVAYYRPEQEQYAYIRDYSKGQQIGFSNTIALHDRIGMAIATTDTVALVVDQKLFNRLRLVFPPEFGLMMLNLARELARTIRSVDDAIVDMKTHGIITDDSGPKR